MNINIEINDVVLDGIHLRENQALELRQALQNELRGLVAANAGTCSKAHTVSIGDTHLESTGHASSPELASRLARSIGQYLPGQQVRQPE